MDHQGGTQLWRCRGVAEAGPRLEKRRRDEPTPSTVLAASHELLGHEVAQDRQTWKHLEIDVVRRVTRTQRDMHIPAGRWKKLTFRKHPMRNSCLAQPPTTLAVICGIHARARLL